MIYYWEISEIKDLHSKLAKTILCLLNQCDRDRLHFLHEARITFVYEHTQVEFRQYRENVPNISLGGFRI